MILQYGTTTGVQPKWNLGKASLFGLGFVGHALARKGQKFRLLRCVRHFKHLHVFVQYAALLRVVF